MIQAARRLLIATSCISLILSSVVLLPRFWGSNTTEAPVYTYDGYDYPEEYPVDINYAALTVEESVHYPIVGPEAIYNWASNNPKGSGYVRLGPNHRILCVSMGHQLHCLRRLRLALVEPDNPLSSVSHAQHCLNYIRQMILCNPDLTLEPFDPLARDFEVERQGPTHVCRDWSTLINVMEKNMDNWIEVYKNSTFE